MPSEPTCSPVTPAGKKEFETLMRSNIRAPSSDDLNKLIITLKLRFLHLLNHQDRQDQGVDNGGGRIGVRHHARQRQAEGAEGCRRDHEHHQDGRHRPPRDVDAVQQPGAVVGDVVGAEREEVVSLGEDVAVEHDLLAGLP